MYALFVIHFIHATTKARVNGSTGTDKALKSKQRLSKYSSERFPRPTPDEAHSQEKKQWKSE
jgi:hypothetical protein